MKNKLVVSHINDRSDEHARHVANHARGGKYPHIDPQAGGEPKHAQQIVPVHGGMQTKSRSGADALSGHHASAIDALSGATVVPAAVKSEPGWGNASARSGNPFAKPPGAKNLKPVEIHPSHRNTPHDADMQELGRSILAQAVRN